MLHEEDIAFCVMCQQYVCTGCMKNEDETKAVFMFMSQQQTKDVHCPYCNGTVQICETSTKHLRDIPLQAGVEQDLCFVGHRYRCTECHRKHAEDIPFRYPGTRITQRAAAWIKSLLLNKISIRTIQKLTGIHWETIRNIHVELMERTLRKHTEELKKAGYHPKYLAVDEFAIRKGHTYATCVMDLETGEVLWVGNGRSQDEFRKFFWEVQPSFLTDVKAVAMDMNASYNLVVKEMLPHVQIVYDRYHMQSQYGKDVLGAVRLQEARKHKAVAQELMATMGQESSEARQETKQLIKAERKQYSEIKKLRWTLLTNGETLSSNQTNHLQEVLENHSDLAVCYALKEEMVQLFRLHSVKEAEEGWRRWFLAAKESGIPALVHFAELKEKRLDGLVAHALFPISTGKLEGFNNKIKVAKRVAYGFRNDSYFFMLVRMLSLTPGFP